MSCSEISQDMSGLTNRRAYFSFRLGAYNENTSGVTLNSAFRTARNTTRPKCARRRWRRARSTATRA